MLPCLVTEEDGNMNYGHGWPTGIERVLRKMFEKFLVSALQTSTKAFSTIIK